MKALTAALIGAGQRGLQIYAHYALDNPNDMRIVAVAEPNLKIRQLAQKLHGIPDEFCFSSWEELLAKDKLADFVMVCTQDRMHYEPVKLALAKGYDVLCEKPMSPSPYECVSMGQLSKQSGHILTICHVLRYSPFFRKIKELLIAGTVGDLVSIQHIENVAFWHQAHSFVRGNWRNSEESSPMILQKSCHDMDILLWLVGRNCLRLSSYGSLKHFRPENAPAGSTTYCLDGCTVANSCPYYAGKLYLEGGMWYKEVMRPVVSLDTSKAALTEALKTGPYGRCVYHCDNDVVDHQVVNMEFEGGITASFTMCAFTYGIGRVINLMGTRGQIIGDMEHNQITINDFVTDNQTNITVSVPAAGSHNGSDVSMMRDFIKTLREKQVSSNLSAAHISVQSHLMVMAAERSRLTNKGVEMKEFIQHIKSDDRLK